MRARVHCQVLRSSRIIYRARPSVISYNYLSLVKTLRVTGSSAPHLMGVAPRLCCIRILHLCPFGPLLTTPTRLPRRIRLPRIGRSDNNRVVYPRELRHISGDLAQTDPDAQMARVRCGREECRPYPARES